jgi:hypothetical protein
MVKSFVMDRHCSESSEATNTTAASTLPPSEILFLSPGKHASETDQEYRQRNAYKWFKILAKPTRETMCQIVEYTKGSDFTREDVDLLPWNFEETEVAEEAMESPKQFAAVRIPDENGVRDHVILCSVSKEEDDDDASIYELDEDGDDSFSEADEEPAPRDTFAAIRVPEEDANLYSQEYQRNKKEIERKEKLEVQKMDWSMTDVSRYQSPTRNTKKFYDPATIGKINSPGIFNFQAEEDPVELSARTVGKNSRQATSKNLISKVAASTPTINEDDCCSKDTSSSTSVISHSSNDAPMVEETCNVDDSGMPAQAISCETEIDDITITASHDSQLADSSEHRDVCREDGSPETRFDRPLTLSWEEQRKIISRRDFPKKFPIPASPMAMKTRMGAFEAKQAVSTPPSARKASISSPSSDTKALKAKKAIPVRSPFTHRNSLMTAKDIEDEKITSVDFQASAVAASPVGRPFARRHSLMTAKYIEHVKIVNDDFQASNVSASPLRPYARRHSLMTAQNIKGEKIANADFQANPIISPTVFQRASVGSTSRPGLPSLRLFDNDDSNPNYEQAHVDKADDGYGISHSSRYSASNEEDDDCTSIYLLDEDGEDCFDGDDDDDDEEAVSKPVHSMRPGTTRGRSYVETQEKEAHTNSLRPGRTSGTAFHNDGDSDDDDEEAVSKPVHSMRPGTTRGRSYVETQEKEAHTNSLRPGRTSGTVFDNDGDSDDDEEAVSKPMHSMRPGTTRGRSYVETQEKEAHKKSLRPGRMSGTAFHNDGDSDDDEESVSKPMHSMRPGTTRGRSYVEDNPPPESSTTRINNIQGASFDGDDDAPEKSPKVKDAEEEKAKVELVELLDQDSKEGKAPVYLKAFSSLRKGYISAVDKLRPQSKPLLMHTKDDRKKEADKAKKYDNLKKAWDTYEDIAQDKPDPEDFTPEEEAAEEKVIEVEAAVNRDWQEYAEVAVKAVQNNDGSNDDSEGDGKCDFWVLEAKRLNAEAERKEADEEKKRKKRENKKRRKEKESHQKRVEKEDGYIVLLKEETGKKKEVEQKAQPSKSEEGNVESNEEKDNRRRERRQRRETAKSKNKSREDAKETVVGSSDDARRRQLAFSWYSQMSAPNRLEFKRKVAALYSLNITPDDVDLLPWNATGSAVNIKKMNALTRQGQSQVV